MTEEYDQERKPKSFIWAEQTRRALAHLHDELWKPRWAVTREDMNPIGVAERFAERVGEAGIELSPYEGTRLMIARILLEHMVHGTNFQGFHLSFSGIEVDLTSSLDFDQEELSLDREVKKVGGEIDLLLLENAILYFLKWVELDGGHPADHIGASFVLWQHPPEHLRQFVEAIRQYEALNFELASELITFISRDKPGKIPHPEHLCLEAWQVITEHLDSLGRVERKIAWDNIKVLLNTGHPLKIIVAQILEKLK